MECYHEKIVRSFVKDLPSTPSPYIPLPDIKNVKPVVNSVSFHRYGKEFAITITGDNLWFCNKVKVGALKQSIDAKNTTQKSLQFNYDIGDTHFSGTVDHVGVKLWSHFASPVSSRKTEVKHKVCMQRIIHSYMWLCAVHALHGRAIA